jgi:threonylcarbamoyladenosine tRNA methylthiotransferase MtaB
LIEEMGLTFLHVFPYSARPDTPAARMPQVPAPARRTRAAALRAAGEAAAARFYRSRLGAEEEVLFERPDRGHTAHFAPIRLVAGEAVPGTLQRLRVIGVAAHGLLAEAA